METAAGLNFDPIVEAKRHWVEHGWGSAAHGMALVTSVIRVQQIFLGAADRLLRPLGLTFARYEVLMLLLFSRRGRLPLGKIGERLQVHAASVTNAIDRLEAERLVVRLQNPDDGRGTLAEITPEGRRLARRATRMLNDRLFSDTGLDPAAIEVTVDNLRSIRAAAGDFDV